MGGRNDKSNDLILEYPIDLRVSFSTTVCELFTTALLQMDSGMFTK